MRPPPYDFVRWTAQGARGWARRGMEAEVSRAIGAVVEGAGTVLKEDGAARTIRVGPLVVKRYPRRVRRPFRAVRAAARLAQAGVAVPEHLAALAGPGVAWLVTRFVEGAAGLDRFLDGASNEEMRGAADRLAEAIRRIHGARVRHRNLKSANLLVSGTAANPTIMVTDLDAAACGPLSTRALVRDLAPLERSHAHLPGWARRRFYARWSRDLPRPLRRTLLRRLLLRTRGARPRRILVVRLSALGDTVHGVPAVRSLRQAHPRAHLTWAVEPESADVARGANCADEILVVPRRRWAARPLAPGTLRDLLGLIALLRRRRFDLAVDLQGLLRSALLCRASGAPERIGYAGAREGASAFYTRRAARPALTEHAVSRYLRIVSSAGARPDRTTSGLEDYRDTDTARRRIDALLAAAGLRPRGFAILVPGAGKAANRWPVARWAHLSDLIRARLGLPVAIVGARTDRPLARAIRRMVTSPVHDLTGRTDLAALAVLLTRARVVVGGDTGPLHLANARGIPCLFLFGPAAPNRTGPRWPGAEAIWSHPACAPCLARNCPEGHHLCLEALSAEVAAEGMARLLASPTCAPRVTEHEVEPLVGIIP